MRRLGLAVALALSLVPLAGEAQRSGKVSKIGYLRASTPERSPTLKSFLHGLRDLDAVTALRLSTAMRAVSASSQEYRGVARSYRAYWFAATICAVI